MLVRSLLCVAIVLAFEVGSSAIDDPPRSTGGEPIVRHYVEGEQLTYAMKGLNEDWRYEIQGSGIVRKDPTGAFFEEYHWSNLVSNRGQALPREGEAFRHELSLDPKHKMVFPNLAQAPLVLIGPVTDLLTFYSDASLLFANPSFSKAGDHKYVEYGRPSSWADGMYVLVGEDSIDFDMTLTRIDRAAKTLTLRVRHVPPKVPAIKVPAEWMRSPVGDTPNNWVEVTKSQGKYVAGIGKETFDVDMQIDLNNGKILSGKLDNTVDQMFRECNDQALTQCGPATQHKIKRNIEIVLQ